MGDLFRQKKNKIFLQGNTEKNTTEILVLKHALFVLSLKRNLVSCSVLDSEGYNILCNNAKCTVMKSGMTYATALLTNGYYVLDINIHPNRELLYITTFTLSRLELLHQTFTNAGMDSLEQMQKNGIVKGMFFLDKANQDVSCTYCIMVKKALLTLSRRHIIPEELGSVMYTDVCGSFPVTTLGENRYLFE